jgi:hypothetical protein
MKKVIIVLWSLLLGSAIFAQFDLGVRVSANYPYLGMDDYQVYLDAVQDPANINGYMTGVFMGTSFGNFGIQLEANAPLENFSIARLINGEPFMDVISGTQSNYQYLNAVLMARFEFDLSIIKPYVGAGINVGVPIVDLINEDVTVDIANFDINQLAYAFSLGVVLLDIVDVDLRYTTGITDIVTQELTTDDPNFGQLVRLSVGFHIF